MGQEIVEIWTAETLLQPILPKSDRLLGPSTLLGQHKIFLLQIDFTHRAFEGLILRWDSYGYLLDLSLTDMIELSPRILIIHNI
jgi:hypothetical protein